MTDKKNVHIVGTGTIGLPLIGLFTRHKKVFDIGEVTFHKNTPLKHDIPNVKKLMRAGAKLCTDGSKFQGFTNLGTVPSYNRRESIENANVVIDCTPKGTALEHKERYYFSEHLKFIHQGNKERLYLAQGSEKGFGKIYAHGINDDALDKSDNFIQVASCNTHAGASLVNNLSKFGDITNANFVYIRRSNDISQNSGVSPSIDVDKHKDWLYGTHHARDIHDVFKTVGKAIHTYSSACKINTQLMHALQYNVTLSTSRKLKPEDIVSSFMEDKMIATTNHTTANKVFSYGREFGHYGRILNHVVVPVSSVACRVIGQSEDTKHYSITGFAYTPQDGNSLLSSVSATLWFLNNRDWALTAKKLQILKKYLFQEI